jgi:hypothetical protein
MLAPKLMGVTRVAFAADQSGARAHQYFTWEHSLRSCLTHGRLAPNTSPVETSTLCVRADERWQWSYPRNTFNLWSTCLEKARVALARNVGRVEKGL